MILANVNVLTMQSARIVYKYSRNILPVVANAELKPSAKASHNSTLKLVNANVLSNVALMGINLTLKAVNVFRINVGKESVLLVRDGILGDADAKSVLSRPVRLTNNGIDWPANVNLDNQLL